MAGSLNQVCLIGNLGQDPEIRRTAAGNPIANLSLATSETWKDKSTGEKREKTEWHRIVIWNENLVNVVEQYVRKGSKIYIEGQLATRKWEDQAGVERWTTEIVLQAFNSKLILLDRRQNGPGKADGPNDYGLPERSPATPDYTEHNDDFDDEIPF